MNRFASNGQTVIDTQTDLEWVQNASLLGFPMIWTEALSSVSEIKKPTPEGPVFY